MPRSRQVLVPYEDTEQEVLAIWLDMLGVRWCHVPMGGNRDLIVAKKLKAQGAKKGVQDVLIFTPPPIGGYVGLAIELKRIKGGSLSPEQKDWRDGLRACGWFTAVCKGADDAMALVRSFGYAKRREM